MIAPVDLAPFAHTSGEIRNGDSGDVTIDYYLCQTQSQATCHDQKP